jgi:hypothetical protein
MILTPASSTAAPLPTGLRDRPPFLARAGEFSAVALTGSPTLTVLDAALVVVGAFEAEPYGQIAVSPDGQRVACGGLASITVRDRTGALVLEQAVPEWWEENAGGVAFSADGRHLLYTSLPNRDEPEAHETIVLRALELATGKVVAKSVPRGFDADGFHQLQLLADGRFLWWANAREEGQRFAVATFDGTRLAINSHPKANDCPFLRCVTPGGDYLVQNRTAVEHYGVRTGAKGKRIDLRKAIGEDEIFSAAPWKDPSGDRILALVLGARGRRRLVLADAQRAEDVSVEGLDGKALAGMITHEGRTLLVDERGAVVMLASPG